MIRHILLTAALFLMVCQDWAWATSVPLEWPVDKYDVTWDSPSQDAKGSMPIGNGDIGLNVWVEPSGDLLLLVAKTDSFDEFNRLLKLGRIRIKTTPALVQPGHPFSQVLKLSDGAIEIKSGTVSIRVWVDANHPVAEVDVSSSQAMTVETTLEDWRNEKRKLTGEETHSARGNWPDKYLVNPDTILPASQGQLAWCHHNEESQWKRNLELTGLASEIPKETDPVIDRTFGAVVRCSGAAALSGTQLRTTQPAKECAIRIYPLTQKAASPAEWLAAAEAGAGAIEQLKESSRLEAHTAWWEQFWNKSWVDIDEARPLSGVISNMTYSGPLQLGHDPAGTERFAGSIAGAVVEDQALGDSEIAQLAESKPGASDAGAVKDISFLKGFTVVAWIKPAQKEAGRIFDKSTPGQGNGLLLDTYPGLSLRYLLGTQEISKPNVLKADEWQHVAATFDPVAGTQKLFLNGKLLEERDQPPGSLAVSRGYALQRYTAACAARGALPLKFNGSLFTVDDGHDPDFRMWGGCYWFQNTRLAYWPMLYSGDFEMMLPFFAMYRNALPLREAATRAYYHHAGAFFPETMYFWGNFDDEDYGFNRSGIPDGLTGNGYISRYWQGGIELTQMMLDYYGVTQDAVFRDKTLLPVARDIVTFFDQHWHRGSDGKILFEPAQSLETWWTAKNPMPEVAGLRCIIPRLLELPVDAATKQQWQKTLADLPPVPLLHDKDGTRLLPAETYSTKSNAENPELYALFPYREYTSLAPDAEKEIGLNTWRHRLVRGDYGWMQDGIQSAMLGLGGEARDMAIARAAATAAGYRFPGFFGPNFDWTPDQDHGNNLVTALQRMLMQCEGRRIVLLPAWPPNWNANFRLHAPLNTVVEGRVENGKLTTLKVTPESRRKDVEVRAPNNADTTKGIVAG